MGVGHLSGISELYSWFIKSFSAVADVIEGQPHQNRKPPPQQTRTDHRDHPDLQRETGRPEERRHRIHSHLRHLPRHHHRRPLPSAKTQNTQNQAHKEDHRPIQGAHHRNHRTPTRHPHHHQRQHPGRPRQDRRDPRPPHPPHPRRPPTHILHHRPRHQISVQTQRRRHMISKNKATSTPITAISRKGRERPANKSNIVGELA